MTLRWHKKYVNDLPRPNSDNVAAVSSFEPTAPDKNESYYSCSCLVSVIKVL